MQEMNVCPVCKKEFYVYSGDWIYKKSHYEKKTTYFCGWNCMREWEKKNEKSTESALKSKEPLYK